MTTQLNLSIQEVGQYYLDVMQQQAPSKTWIKFLEKTEGFFADLVEQVSDNPEYLMERFQSVIERTIVTYPVGQLMRNAPLQQQYGLDIKRIASIWTDSKIGIPKVGCLLEMPVVGVRPDGSLFLLGGNHKIAALVAPMLEAGLEPEMLDEIPIQVMQVSIDTEALSNYMGNPDKGAVYNMANELLLAMWYSNNQSRRVSSAEYNDAQAFKIDIDRNDPDAILEACFVDSDGVKLIDTNTCARYLVEYFLSQDTANMLPKEEVPSGSFAYQFNIQGQPRTLTTKTLESITKAFLSSLGKISETKTTTNSKGEVKEKNIYYWKKDLQDADNFSGIVEWFANHIEYGINSYLQTLDASDEYRSNVARNSANIGNYLATKLDADSEPTIDPRKIEKKSATKGKARKSLGLAL